MRIWIRRGIGLLLVISLMLMPGTAARATEPTEAAETVPVQETLPPETVPEPTEIPATQPAETEPAEEPTEEPAEEPTEEPTEPPVVYTVDTGTEIYGLLDELAQELVSDQILVYDATNDKIIYTMTNEGDKLYPASITKLFSTYVALQYLDPEEVITAGDELSLVKPGSSMAYIGKGHKLYARTVVEAMMLPSGNDAAMVLAAAAGRRIAGDESLAAAEAVQTFVAEMNRMAKELGFEKTHFSNPDGFHTGSHYTCLTDMARIAKLALGNSVISRYMRRAEDEVVFVSGQAIQWKNTNLLLNREEGFYRGDAIGMKTGFTRQAEYCLMSAFKCQDGRTLVIGAFGSDEEFGRLRDILKLVNLCQSEMRKGTF